MAQIDAPDGINVRFWLGPDNFRIADHLEAISSCSRFAVSTRSAFPVNLITGSRTSRWRLMGVGTAASADDIYRCAGGQKVPAS